MIAVNTSYGSCENCLPFLLWYCIFLQNAHCYVTGGFRAKVDQTNNFTLKAPIIIAYAGISANFVSIELIIFDSITIKACLIILQTNIILDCKKLVVF